MTDKNTSKERLQQYFNLAHDTEKNTLQQLTACIQKKQLAQIAVICADEYLHFSFAEEVINLIFEWARDERGIYAESDKLYTFKLEHTKNITRGLMTPERPI